MKFTVDKSALVDALSRCVQIADPKSPMPMLQNVYLECGPALMVAATDIMRSVIVDIPEAKSDEQGQLCLNARDLYDRVKQLPDGKISLVADGTKATLKTVGHSRKFTMHGIPALEFPSLPEIRHTDAKLEIAATDLARLIASVHFSISTDVSRPILNAMLLEFTDSGVRTVSTNGHCVSTALLGADPSGTRWLVPLVVVNDIRKLLAAGGAVVLTQDGETLFLKLGEVTYSAKLTPSEYPTWQHAIPVLPRTVTVERQALLGALGAVSVASSVLNGGVQFTFRKGTLVLEAASSTAGEGFDEVLTDYDGPEGSVSLSSSYVLEALRATGADQITISSGGPKDAPVIRAGDDYLAVIMPLMPQ